MTSLLLSILFFPQTSQTAPPPRVADLIYISDLLNDKCRDNPDAQKACDLRERVDAQIKAAGWCYGHAGQFEADKVWEPCIAKKTAP